MGGSQCEGSEERREQTKAWWQDPPPVLCFLHATPLCPSWVPCQCASDCSKVFATLLAGVVFVFEMLLIVGTE